MSSQAGPSTCLRNLVSGCGLMRKRCWTNSRTWGAVMRFVHEVGEAVELCRGRDLLFCYVYKSEVDSADSPKP
jgi:hypothetical protein